MLTDKSIRGKIVLGKDHKSVDVHWGEYSIVSNFPLSGKEKAGDFATPQPLRFCDAYASAFGNIAGMPEFPLCSSLAKRDAALQSMIDILQHYGARYAYTPDLPVTFPPTTAPLGYPHARMSFPRLIHPATEEDVKQGRAIFPLPANSVKRQVPMPAVPLAARWTRQSKYPSKFHMLNPATWELEMDGYDQSALVWQVEEQRVNGVWRRWYGIVGRHELAKVPAEDVEFINEHALGTGRLTHGIACRLSLPDGNVYGAGVPKTIIVTLRNYRGVAQRVPVELFRTGADGKPALRRGIELLLRYTPVTWAIEKVLMEDAKPVTLSSPATFTPTHASRFLRRRKPSPQVNSIPLTGLI